MSYSDAQRGISGEAIRQSFIIIKKINSVSIIQEVILLQLS